MPLRAGISVYALLYSFMTSANSSIGMQRDHVVKAQPQYCSNVCMKLNAKLGGTTCRVAGKTATTSQAYFKVPTMIIGADVSHASPGSQQASMAAMTVSMDKDACRYAAAVQTNGKRVEMIGKANIKSMFMPLFRQWVNKMGCGPTHIYYFRDGVSEGQYIHVLEQEVTDMKAAIDEAYPGKGSSVRKDLNSRIEQQS
jgi:eukaryotic translation initiation factor 2C